MVSFGQCCNSRAPSTQTLINSATAAPRGLAKARASSRTLPSLVPSSSADGRRRRPSWRPWPSLRSPNAHRRSLVLLYLPVAYFSSRPCAATSAESSPPRPIGRSALQRLHSRGPTMAWYTWHDEKVVGFPAASIVRACKRARRLGSSLHSVRTVTGGVPNARWQGSRSRPGNRGAITR
jgi:hypothetical protein